MAAEQSVQGLWKGEPTPGVEVRIHAPGMTVRATWMQETAPWEPMAGVAPAWGLSKLRAHLEAEEIERWGRPLQLQCEAADKPAGVTIVHGGQPGASVTIEVPRPEEGRGVLIALHDDTSLMWLTPTHFASGNAWCSVVWIAQHPDPELLAGPRAFRFAVPATLLKEGAKLTWFGFEWLADVTKGIASRIDALLAGSGELVPFALKKGAALTLDQDLPRRSLLLVHGTLSSVESAFSALRDHSELCDALSRRYHEIIAWKHNSVTRTCRQNAEALLEALENRPRPLLLDIVCHSRGSLVVRTLLEHPHLAERSSKAIRHVGKVVFVAGVNRGTPLAKREHMDVLLSIYLQSALTNVSEAQSLRMRTLAMKLVGHGAELPGIGDMDPSSVALQEINAPGMFPAERYVAIRANFACGSGWQRVMESLVKPLFEGAQHDLVVPFDGAIGFDEAVAGEILHVCSFEKDLGPQAKVYHNNFLEQQWVADTLQRELCND